MTWRNAITLLPGDYLMDYHIVTTPSMWEEHTLVGGLYKVLNVRRSHKCIVDVEAVVVQTMADDTTKGIGCRVTFYFGETHSYPNLFKVIEGAILNGYEEKDPEWVEILKHQITLARQDGNFNLTYSDGSLYINIFTDRKRLLQFHTSERLIYLSEEEATLFRLHTPKQLIGFELPVWFSHSHVRQHICGNVTASHKGVILDVTPMWEVVGFIPLHRRWGHYKAALYKDFIKRGSPYDTAF